MARKNDFRYTYHITKRYKSYSGDEAYTDTYFDLSILLDTFDIRAAEYKAKELVKKDCGSSYAWIVSLASVEEIT